MRLFSSHSVGHGLLASAITLFTFLPSMHAKTSTNTLSTMMNVQDPQGNMDSRLEFLRDLRKKYSHQPTFLQSVEEIAISLLPLFEDREKGEFYKQAFVAMTEPERVISFRVPWMDDNGVLHFNRGWRVEFSRQEIVIG